MNFKKKKEKGNPVFLEASAMSMHSKKEMI